MSFSRIALIVLVATFWGCSAPTQEGAADQSAPQTQKEFLIDVRAPNLGLTGPTLSVAAVHGKFVGCEDPDWTIGAATGSVYASVACVAPEYLDISVVDSGVQGAEPIVLRFNSSDSYTDSQGNVWTFQSNPSTGKSALFANFSAEQQDVTVQLNNKRITIEVETDAGDGAICDVNTPFTASVTATNQLLVSLNPPQGGFVDGTVLSVGTQGPDLPAVRINDAGRRFEANFSNLEPRDYVFSGGFTASKGRSFCRLKKLTVDLRSEAEPDPSDCSAQSTQNVATVNLSFGAELESYPQVDQRFVRLKNKSVKIVVPLQFDFEYMYSMSMKAWFFKPTPGCVSGNGAEDFTAIFGEDIEFIIQVDDGASGEFSVGIRHRGGTELFVSGSRPSDVSSTSLPVGFILAPGSLTGRMTSFIYGQGNSYSNNSLSVSSDLSFSYSRPRPPIVRAAHLSLNDCFDLESGKVSRSVTGAEACATPDDFKFRDDSMVPNDPRTLVVPSANTGTVIADDTVIYMLRDASSLTFCTPTVDAPNACDVQLRDGSNGVAAVRTSSGNIFKVAIISRTGTDVTIMFQKID